MGRPFTRRTAESATVCAAFLRRPSRKNSRRSQTFTEEFLAKVSDDSLVKVMVTGVGKAEDMKSFKDKLNPQEMAAVAKYVREIGSKNKG